MTSIHYVCSCRRLKERERKVKKGRGRGIVSMAGIGGAVEGYCISLFCLINNIIKSMLSQYHHISDGPNAVNPFSTSEVLV